MARLGGTGLGMAGCRLDGEVLKTTDIENHNNRVVKSCEKGRDMHRKKVHRERDAVQGE